MKGVLGLAADFLDQLANPAYGTEENERHAIRFNELLARDAELRETLARSDLRREDVDLLSTQAWLWYLAWRRSEGAALPDDSFVDALFDRTADPVVRLKIVEAAATDPGLSHFRDYEKRWQLETVPASWLGRRLVVLTRRGGGEQAPAEAESGEALEMAMLLLQVGNDAARAYLRAFLAEQWRFQGLLREVVQEALVAATGEDETALAQWRGELGL